jgi:hypothetical protein
VTVARRAESTDRVEHELRIILTLTSAGVHLFLGVFDLDYKTLSMLIIPHAERVERNAEAHVVGAVRTLVDPL